MGGLGSEKPEQAAQKQVEQDVGGLRGHDQPLRAAALDQLRQPGVVNVAGEVAGLNARLPVTGRQQQRGKRRVSRANAKKPAELFNTDAGKFL